MYTLIVNDNNNIYTSKKERIVQRSKLVDSVHILLPINYKGTSMIGYEVTMQYELPVSKERYSLQLTQSPDIYKEDYLEYIIPADTWITKEAGTVEIELIISKVEIDENSVVSQYVRKATGGTVVIASCEDWASAIPDGLLQTIDQRIIELQMLSRAIDEANQDLYEICASKADNLSCVDNYLQLVSNNVKIGDKILIHDSKTPEEYADGDVRVINI